MPLHLKLKHWTRYMNKNCPSYFKTLTLKKTNCNQCFGKEERRKKFNKENVHLVQITAVPDWHPLNYTSFFLGLLLKNDRFVLDCRVRLRGIQNGRCLSARPFPIGMKQWPMRFIFSLQEKQEASVYCYVFLCLRRGDRKYKILESNICSSSGVKFHLTNLIFTSKDK